ncbi:HPP family protein [Stutzerimonas xanthomarina]|uniref:CBS domain-containing membrane protein n=2 Tax=Stutzerimonas xanthomarina TaxID=271420 RepID=A0A1M5QLE9_9GAMM|nr:HPP family protein [Stutzerimonas xanthomarina]MCP9338527.1 HPP family protein [Stutzerimonas xanthomarina]SEH67216.1 CBS domain-containing membrane protein [Stutzerimonas xanthomarina]SHH14599.1 CBS domain-containing membrane protein [Stutzerimonas xanthomarina DSM 18231]
MQERLLEWCRSFAPTPFSARPVEWLRAATGIGLALLLVIPLSAWVFGMSVALPLAAPAAASAVLLFVAPSSPFAQPWSVIVGSLLATAIGIAMGASPLSMALAAGLAGALAIICLFGLRCLHPPGAALALVAVVGGPELHVYGFQLLYPVAFNSLLLVTVALIYNNLSGHPYPKPRLPKGNLHHTQDPLPSERMSFSEDDVERALVDFGEYVDITRDDLAQLIKQTEKHALRRSMGEITAADIMSRDLYWSTPDCTIQRAWQSLREHRLHSLPVLQPDSHELVGIVTLVDLLKHFRPASARINFGQLKFLRGVHLRTIMSTPVVSVTEDTHMVDLVFMLSDRGLHCLPVVDDQQRLVGMITQTDLIAALYRNWLKHLPD